MTESSEIIKQPPTLAMLREKREEILALAAHYQASNVRVFGSVARGEATVDSDVDLLVDLPVHYSLLKFSGLVGTLREAIGWRVEVASATHLHEEFRDSILNDANSLADI